MEQPRRRLFTNKMLVLLIVPIIFETMLTQLVSMVDGIMVSSVGEVAISAVSLVGNVTAVMTNLIASLAAGGSIVTSQLIGAEKKKEARRSAGQVITMTACITALVSLACLVCNRALLSLFFGKVEKAVLDDAVTYFYFDGGSLIFLGVCSAGGAVLRAKGDSKTMFYIGILRNLVNITGNAICIYGLGMGVEGVALPTALSRVVGAVVIMLVVMKKDQPLRPAPSEIFHINTRLMGRMLRLGLPTAIENSIFQLGRVMTLSMISGFSTAQIAANSTANALTGMVVVITSAIRTGSLTVIGQCVGARDEEQIRENNRKLLLMGYVLNGLAAAAVVILRKQLIGLYVGLSPEAAALAGELMCIHLIPSILLYPLSFQLTGPLRAANDSAFPMWVSILSMAIFRLTLAQILCVNLEWGARGVWIAMVVDWVCRSICFTWRWYSGAWKKKCGLAELPAK